MLLVDVFFDDLKVAHTKSPIVQQDDYYPFGLTFNSYHSENSVPNRWKFQGQEHVDDLGLNWDSFKWRNHQPDIGRFFNVDPLASDYVYNSPYAFSENKVTNHIELEGLESYPAQQALNNEIKKVEDVVMPIVNKVGDVVNKIVDAIIPDKQVGPTELEKRNPPKKTTEKQRDGGVIKTEVPSPLDGIQAPQYNPDGTAKGNKGGDQVVTQGGGQTRVEDPDKPDPSIKIDTLWGNIRVVDDASKDSTTTYREYRTSWGDSGEQEVKKVKGSTPWMK